MSILLTKIETSEVLIRQVREDGKYIEDRQYEYLNKAQLKKVVEYISPYIYSKKGAVHICMTLYAWQQLLKEAEVE